MIPDYDDVKDGDFLFTLDLIASILSFLGSILMCYFCMRIPSPKSISIKFIFAIAISDLFYSIANIMSVFETEENFGYICMAEAVIRQSSFTFSIFFSACTAIVSYEAFLPQSTFNRVKFFKVSVILFPILYIIATLFGPLFLSEYVIYRHGPINCSIQSYDLDNLLLNFVIETVYRGIPICVGLIISVVGYIKIIRKMKEISSSKIAEVDFQISNLLWYPVGLILIFSPAVIEPVLRLIFHEIPTWIMAIRIGVPHSIGFINALMYIMLRKLYSKVNENSQMTLENEREFFSLDGSVVSALN